MPEAALDNWQPVWNAQVSSGRQNLPSIHEQLETNVCVLSTMATDVMVLKYQAISIHSANKIFIILDQFHIKHCI